MSRCISIMCISANCAETGRSGETTKMSDSFDGIFGGTNNLISGQKIDRRAPFATNAVREFLPQISPHQIEKIKSELHGMIGQRIVLSNDEVVQVRRAVNVLLQEPNTVLTNAMSNSRVVAILSSEPAAGVAFISALREGGATHLAMNLPKIFQPSLDKYQASGNKDVLNDLLKYRGFKHPLTLLEGAALLGIKLIAVGDQLTDQPERKGATIESIALDVANILDAEKRHNVVLWASSQYLKRSKDKTVCSSALDYLALNYSIFSVHNGNYLVDGGPLRKIVFDLQCPGALTSGRNRIIDNLATGIEGDVYGDWDAILLQPRPALDHSYFLTND